MARPERVARPEPWRGPNEGGPERGRARTGAPLHHPQAAQPHIAAAHASPAERGQDRTTLKQPSPTSPKAPTRPAERGLGERQWKSRRATPKSGSDLVLLGSPNGIRTRASTLRGWCPRPLDDGAMLHSALLPSYVFTGRGPVVGEQGIEP